MPWILIAIIVVIIISRFLPTKGVTNITVQQAKDKLKEKDTRFIDVRTPSEYKTHHHAKFINIPLANLASKLDTLDKDQDIVVICQSGMRSKRAAKFLKRQGFKSIYNVKGGMSVWY